MKATLLIIAVAFSLSAFAQDKPVIPKVTVTITTADQQNKILKAEHAHDLIVKRQADLQARAAQISQEMQTIQRQWDALAPDEKKTADAVDAAITEVKKSIGCADDAHAFDPANFTCTEKPPAQKAAK